MATKISWCDETINPVVGCSKISAGCQNCYAEKMARRLACMGHTQYQDVIGVERNGIIRGEWNGTTAFVYSELEKPYKWKKPRTIFVSSMGDLFHETVCDGWLHDVLFMVRQCSQHTFIILTKRPYHMQHTLTKHAYYNGVISNLAIGVSIEDQQTADERIPALLATPAAKRFISLEPMVGSVSIDSGRYSYKFGSATNVHDCGIHGVILGGESGPKARPLHPEWVRTIRDQCAASGGVPFMFKQWGEWAPVDAFEDNTPVWQSYGNDGYRRHIFDVDSEVVRVGRKAAGNLLDGKAHMALPW